MGPRGPRRFTSGRIPAVATLATALAAALVTGCAGSGSQTDAGHAPAAGARAPADARGEAAPGSQLDSAAKPAAGAPGSPGKGTLARVVPQDQHLIRRAEISVEIGDADVAAKARKAKELVSAAGGYLFEESYNRGDDAAPGRGERDKTATPGSQSGRLVFKVPPKEFDAVVDSLSGLGKRLDAKSSTEDVTDQVVDVEARINSQRQSVNRVQALLSRAKTLGEIVQIESELTRRVADLEALQARLKALTAQTANSTVTVNLSVPDAPEKEPAEAAGFMVGLRGGLEVFVTSVVVLATVLGAVLPFLVLVLVLLPPARWLLRRYNRRYPRTRATAPPGPPAPTPADG